MNTKTDEGLYEKARKLFISKASIDEFAGWATPRQVDASTACSTRNWRTGNARSTTAPAPRPVPRRQGSRRLRLHERQAPRRLHAR